MEYNCGVHGNCWIYDNDRLSFNSILLCIPFVIVSAILIFFAMVTYPAKKQEKMEDDTKSSEPVKCQPQHNIDQL